MRKLRAAIEGDDVAFWVGKALTGPVDFGITDP
jgi:hypothetical protein